MAYRVLGLMAVLALSASFGICSEAEEPTMPTELAEMIEQEPMLGTALAEEYNMMVRTLPPKVLAEMKLTASPTPVSDLSMTSYAGEWFLLASSLSTTLTFLRDCSCIKANYNLENVPPGGYFFGLTNTCTTSTSQQVFASELVPTSGAYVDPAQEVFTPLADFAFRLMPASPPSNIKYQVVWVDAFYDLAVVAGPNAWLSPIFILSRFPAVPPQDYQAAIQGAIDAGVPAIRLTAPFLKDTTPC